MLGNCRFTKNAGLLFTAVVSIAMIMPGRGFVYADPANLHIEGAASIEDGMEVGGDLTVGGQIVVGSGEYTLTNAAGLIDGAMVQSGSITGTQLGSGAVGTGNLATGAVTEAKIGLSAVTVNKIHSDAVTADKIASGAVIAQKIAQNAITADKILSAAVAPSKLNTGGTYQVGKLGIGTATVPHDGIGAGILALHGPDANLSGPHFQATTESDNYPLFYILPWTHDTVCIRFDAYWDGSQKSSDGGSNASIGKSNDCLSFKFAHGKPQGTTFYWETAMEIGLTDGSVKMPEVFKHTVTNGILELFIDNTGKLGHEPSSSIEVKENIRDTTEQDTAWIYNLRPVMFDYRDPAQGLNQCGLIAEEVAAVHPDIVSYKHEITYGPEETDANGNPDPSGDRPMIVTATNQPQTVNYRKLTVPMLAEMQKLRNRVMELEAQLEQYQALEARVAALEARE